MATADVAAAQSGHPPAGFAEQQLPAVDEVRVVPVTLAVSVESLALSHPNNASPATKQQMVIPIEFLFAITFLFSQGNMVS